MYTISIFISMCCGSDLYSYTLLRLTGPCYLLMPRVYMYTKHSMLIFFFGACGSNKRTRCSAQCMTIGTRHSYPGKLGGIVHTWLDRFSSSYLRHSFMTMAEVRKKKFARDIFARLFVLSCNSVTRA